MFESNRQVIADFCSANKGMLDLSAMALASLLVVAPFNSGSSRVTRESAITMFIGCAVVGKIGDVLVGGFLKQHNH